MLKISSKDTNYKLKYITISLGSEGKIPNYAQSNNFLILMILGLRGVNIAVFSFVCDSLPSL